MQVALLRLAVLCGASAASLRLDLRHGKRLASDGPAKKSRLPIRHPERVAEVCGFDDTADSLPADSPWGQYANAHPKYLAAGRVLRYRGALQGHGTRLRGLLYSFLLAMRSKRALIVEWPGLETPLMPNFVDWRTTDSRAADVHMWYGIGDPELPNVADRREHDEVLVKIGCVPVGGAWTAHGPPFRCGWNLDEDVGMLQLTEHSRTSWNLLGCATRFLLRPTARLDAELAQGQWLSSPAGVMGVQMRFGDKTAFNASHTTSFGNGVDVRLTSERESVDKMLKCASKPYGQVFQSRPRLLFASDWDKARKWAVEATVVSSQVEVVTLAASPVHADLVRKGDPASIELALWTELLMLGAAARLAITGSRHVTQELYSNNLFNNSDHGALCRGSAFGMAAASMGLLRMNEEVVFGAEDCNLGCAESHSLF